MNMNKLKMMAAALSAATVVACGGGGEVAGDSTEFMLSQDEWTIKGGTEWVRMPDGTLAEEDICPAASPTPYVVTIIGGQPPFRIRNPLPTVVQVDRTETDGKDPRFVFTVLGGCAEFSITVHDYHSRVASVEVKLEAGKP